MMGGMEKIITIKANYLSNVLGYDVTIVNSDGANKTPYFKLSSDVKVINLGVEFEKIRTKPLIIKAFLYSIKQLQFRRRLSRLLKEQKPHITVSTLRREINFLTKIKDGSIKVGEIHFNKSNFRDFGTRGEEKGAKALFAKLWMAQLIKRLRELDSFVVLSYEDKEKWTELSNVSVIYNPIDKFPEVASDCTNKKVIAAGRFAAQKGFDMLLKSWSMIASKYPDWSLHIYGSGERAPYIKLAKELGIEGSVTLHDPLPDLTRVMTGSSIFAFSSRYEGFSLMLTEALSYGLAAVAFACPCGPKELIEDGVDGILVAPEEVEQFAEALSYLIENKDIRIGMGKLARERAKDFALDKIMNQWDAHFRELISKE